MADPAPRRSADRPAELIPVAGHDLGILVVDLVGQILAEPVQLGGQAGIGQRHDPHGQERGVRAPLTATVATGMPLGIWTMASSESSPPRLASATGTPITGSGVAAAPRRPGGPRPRRRR